MKINPKSLARRNKVLKGVIQGNTIEEIAEDSGISKRQVIRIKQSPEFQNTLGVALDKAGLSDDKLAEILTKTTSGAGEKATNSDAIRAVELAAKLKGYMTKEPDSVTNTYINELKVLSVGDLQKRVESLMGEITELNDN